MYDGYIGSYSTRTFGEIFPTSTDFATFYSSCGVPAKLRTRTTLAQYDINAIYALLCAEYMNEHVRSASEDRFKLAVMKTIFSYGPTWQREMEMQDKLLDMTDADMLKGSKQLYNHAANPNTTPAVSSVEELTYIDDQNATHNFRNALDAYGDLMSLLDDKPTERFISKFKPLFGVIAYPGNTIYFESEEDET